MSKDDPPSGFLSKMVKFVRHPATSWNELDSLAGGADRGQSTQQLREMIERKRRNDFVRKREFDMLRKLRARLPAAESGYGGKPSFFQSSVPEAADDRAGTLKKIDEIEAQMSMQWWKTKQSSAGPAYNPVTLPPQEMDSRLSYRTTVVLDKGDTRAQPTTTLPAAQTLPPTEPLATKPLTVGERTAPEATPPSEVDDLFGPSGFESSKFYAVDVQELAMDPEIEEAAIRFASGDDTAAEQGLLDILTRKGNEGSVDEWMALFDLYRATGRLESFENQAVDFANRFSRSAPQWFSMPEEVAARQSRVRTSGGGEGRTTWATMPELDSHAVTLLAKTLERSAQPWVLDWSELRSIQPVAAVRLLKLMNDWGAQPVDLHFIGAGRLTSVLQTQTPSSQRTVDRVWWDLRMATLRVMHMDEEFESTALDFCVTYEVSPPAWERPHCHFKALEGPEGQPVVATAVPSQVGALQATSDAVGNGVDLMATASFQFSPQAATELWGELLGDPQAALERLDAALGDANPKVVSCRCLMRVDFSAAGGILNWVSAQRAQGREVRFTEVHRLISAFFHVIGITEHAKVVTRHD